MPDDTRAARWLDRDALASHLRLRPSAVSRLVAEGRLPRPSYHLGPRLPRWDVTQVDARMAGGLASTDAREAIATLAQEIRRRA